MKSLTLIILLLFVCGTANSQTINSGSTGADGPFSPPNPKEMPKDSTVVGSCTQASPCTVTVPLREPEVDQPIQANGRHVFNFTSVNIPQYVTVKFTRNQKNTPVFILVQGDVTINGTIDVSGSSGGSFPVIGTGGPGGFDGGVGPLQSSPTDIPGAGMGPGGGAGVPPGTGVFATGNLAYGLAEIQPLIGGSGGAGLVYSYPSQRIGISGGGGGGAVLLAASGTVDLGTGTTYAIFAKGGNNLNFGSSSANYVGRPGSGGAIRIVATLIKGNRPLSAAGGTAGIAVPVLGGVGRIRLDSFRPLEYTGTTSPAFTKNDNPLFGQNITVFPPLTPTLRIVSIGGFAVPTQATAFVYTPDIALPTGFSNPVAVVVEGRYVPSNTPFEVHASPQVGSGDRVIAQGVLVGNPGQLKTATVNVNLPPSGVGVISAVIRTAIVPEPAGAPVQ